jgi:hypothetical protein
LGRACLPGLRGWWEKRYEANINLLITRNARDGVQKSRVIGSRVTHSVVWPLEGRSAQKIPSEEVA